MLVSLLAPNPAILAIGAVLTGFAMAVWGLARQSYLAGALPIHMRARGISANAAMHRAGFLVGPFVGAVAVHRFGIQGGLMVEFVAIIVAGILITRSTVPEPQRSDKGGEGVLGVARSHHVVLLTLGAGSMLVGASRASREAVLPLWAEHIGVAPATVALVFGISGAVDLLLAYPAGVLMDKCGRLVTAIPALLLFGTAFLILPLIHELWWLIVVAVVLGAGNGMSNGLVMTLGADVSPPDRRAEFLAAWRLTHDTGVAHGPAGGRRGRGGLARSGRHDDRCARYRGRSRDVAVHTAIRALPEVSCHQREGREHARYAVQLVLLIAALCLVRRNRPERSLRLTGSMSV